MTRYETDRSRVCTYFLVSESARLLSVHLFSNIIIALQNTKAIWNLFDSLIMRIDCKGHQKSEQGATDEYDEQHYIALVD